MPNNRRGRPTDRETDVLRYQVLYLKENEGLSNTQIYEALQARGQAFSPEYVPKLLREAKERIADNPNWANGVILYKAQEIAEALEKAGYDLANPLDHDAIRKIVANGLATVESDILRGVGKHKRDHPRAKVPKNKRIH